MSSARDVIPIGSPRTSAASAPPPAAAEKSTRGGLRPLLIITALVAVIGALLVLSELGRQQSVVRISPAVRQAIFDRSRVDLRETCNLPEASDGLLREHCIQQASFVLQFPECDPSCERAARGLLPHATR